LDPGIARFLPRLPCYGEYCRPGGFLTGVIPHTDVSADRLVSFFFSLLFHQIAFFYWYLTDRPPPLFFSPSHLFSAEFLFSLRAFRAGPCCPTSTSSPFNCPHPPFTASSLHSSLPAERSHFRVLNQRPPPFPHVEAGPAKLGPSSACPFTTAADFAALVF